jgi:hypothetical protein
MAELKLALLVACALIDADRRALIAQRLATREGHAIRA